MGTKTGNNARHRPRESFGPGLLVTAIDRIAVTIPKRRYTISSGLPPRLDKDISYDHAVRLASTVPARLNLSALPAQNLQELDVC